MIRTAHSLYLALYVFFDHVVEPGPELDPEAVKSILLSLDLAREQETTSSRNQKETK